MGQPDLRRGLTTSVHRVLETLAPATSVVVAVSGGADSVALLHLVHAARPDLAITVGHVRHGLRDDTADAAAARRNAEQLGVAFAERTVTVGQGDGPEDAARRVRHEALAAIATLVGAAVVLLGHTADDQAETVLLRIARGTGIDGLAGMAVDSRRGELRLLRPLLDLRRADVRRILPSGSWVEDPTNADADQRRSRARHEALPAMARLRPDEGDVVPALCRLAALARRDTAVLEELIALVPLPVYGPARLVPREPEGLPAAPAVHARLLRRAWRLLPGDVPPPPAGVIEEILQLPTGGRIDAPHAIAVTASRQGWVVCPDAGGSLPSRRLIVPGTVTLPEHHLVLHCTAAAAAAPDPSAAAAAPDPSSPSAPEPSSRLVSSPALDPPPWTLRLPLGTGPLRVGGRDALGGRQARRVLQERWPAGLRHLVPLVADDAGRVLAVGSHPLVTVASGQPCLTVRATATVEPVTGAVGYPAPP